MAQYILSIPILDTTSDHSPIFLPIILRYNHEIAYRHCMKIHGNGQISYLLLNKWNYRSKQQFSESVVHKPCWQGTPSGTTSSSWLTSIYQLLLAAITSWPAMAPDNHSCHVCNLFSNQFLLKDFGGLPRAMVIACNGWWEVNESIPTGQQL